LTERKLISTLGCSATQYGFSC